MFVNHGINNLQTGINMYVTENAGYYPSNYIDRVNNKDYRYYNLIAGYLDVEEKIDIDNLGTGEIWSLGQLLVSVYYTGLYN